MVNIGNTAGVIPSKALTIKILPSLNTNVDQLTFFESIGSITKGFS